MLKVMWFVPPPIAIVAESIGPFKVDGIRSISSNEQFEQLSSGCCDAVVTAMDNVFAWRRRNSTNDFEIIGEIEKTTPLSLVAKEDIASITDLRGATILVDAPENGFVVALMAILKRSGINRTEYRLQDVGGVRERCEALVIGAGDATLLGPPYDALALTSGMKEITRVQNEFPLFPGQGIVIKKSISKEKREKVLRWLSSLENARRSVEFNPMPAIQSLKNAGYDEVSALAAIRNFPSSLIPSSHGIEILRDHRKLLDLPGYSETYDELVSHDVLSLG